MVNPDEIRELLAAHHEWLLVRETGRTFPLNSPEIEITAEGDKTLVGFIGDDGFHDWRLHSFEFDGNELTVSLSREFGKRESGAARAANCRKHPHRRGRACTARKS
ncbi:MAG: hypothetical protein IPK98_06440 [Chloracidobacterium sp.]|nr:hypothetical protein [Chloracidobacterium sp.]